MPNKVVVFTTSRGENYGSSLYLITKEWVLRCSGNTNGRDAEVFARKRNIVYKKAGAVFDLPALALVPVEGGHTGNPISAVLNDTGEIPQDAPDNWNANNGVSWQTAATEVLAAEAAILTSVSGAVSHRKARAHRRFAHL